MRRPERETLLALALLAALALALVAVAVLQGRSGAAERYDPRVSTMRSGIRGAKAYYFLLRELGFDADRHFAGPGALPAESVTVAILSPIAALRPVERDSILERVEAGDGLLIASGAHAGPILEDLGFETRFVQDSLAVRPAGLFEARGADALSAAHAFFRAADDAPPFEPLIVSDSGPVALTFGHGDGRVVAFADARYFTNRDLRSGDNAVVAVNAVAAFWERRLLFDEYHQGFKDEARLERSVAAFLIDHPLGWASLQLVVAGLALLALNARRLGAPRPPRPPQRRSEMEHVEALAAAYEKARANALAADRIAHGLARRLRVRGQAGEDLWDALEHLVPEGELRAKVRRLRALRRDGLTASALTEWGGLVHDVEEEVRSRWRSSARPSSPARR